MRRSVVVICGLGLLILMISVVWGLARFSSRQSVLPWPSSNIRNVLLISIDTCRADHLGCYGHPGNTTPHIDALARAGILFDNALSPVPARASMWGVVFPG